MLAEHRAVLHAHKLCPIAGRIEVNENFPSLLFIAFHHSWLPITLQLPLLLSQSPVQVKLKIRYILTFVNKLFQLETLQQTETELQARSS